VNKPVDVMMEREENMPDTIGLFIMIHVPSLRAAKIPHDEYIMNELSVVPQMVRKFLEDEGQPL
jgi:hypothetical protein